MASGIPKRATNKRKQETRKASWERGQKRKEERKLEQAAREEHNKSVGTTGKQRANQVAKEKLNGS